MLFIFSILLVFALLEIYLRVSGQYRIVRVGNELDYFGQFDPELGWSNKPKTSGLMEVGEGIVTEVKINRYGMRGKEYNLEKKNPDRRIVVLGDSFTFGLGVNNDEIFTDALEKKLVDRFEVLNFGVGGYGIDQEYLLLKNRAILFKPDIVLCAFYVGNDFFETSSSRVGEYDKPVFEIVNGVLVLTNVPVQQKKLIFYSSEGKVSILIKKLLRNHLYAYGFLIDRIKILSYQLNKKAGNKDLSLKDLSCDGRVIPTTGIYNPDDPANKDLYRLVETIILEMKSFCDKQGVKFCLVIIPHYKQLEDDSNYPQNRLLDFCLKKGISVVDLLSLFKNEPKYSLGNIYYKHDMHWTKYGHAVAADIIYEHLYKLRLLEADKNI